MMELIVDSFAGGGGASTGIEMALGRSPDYAINHDAEALALHAANHPETVHLSKNIWQVDPLDVVGRRPVGLAWFSPDCKHFSKAKGGAPVERNIRDLAWTVVLWAERVRPRVIIIENVEEFRSWGPLIDRGDGRLMPDPGLKGKTFDKWVRALKRLGYRVEWRELRASDYGAPTIRKRLFVIARRDGEPIVWPTPTHGDPSTESVQTGRLKPWRTAAEIIDWSLPCPSIFATSEEIKKALGIRAKRPLAEATMARIAKGVVRYVVNAAKPFIVPITHSGDVRVNSIDEPVRTQTTAHRGEHALVTPFIAGLAHGDSEAGGKRLEYAADDPLTTVHAGGGNHALVTPFVTKFNRGATGHRADEPLHTITAAHSDTHPGGAAPLGVVAPVLLKNNHGDKQWTPADDPVRTICTGNNHLLAAPYLIPRYGERDGQEPRTRSVEEPLPAIVPTGNGASVVAAFLAQHNTGVTGHDAVEPLSTIVGKGCTQGLVAVHLDRQFGKTAPASIDDPIGTITAGGDGKTNLVAAHLLNLRGSDRRDGVADAPLWTSSAGGNHAATVAAFLTKYYGEGGTSQRADEPLHTVTTKPRVGVVTVTIDGEPYVIVDIGMRMLTPRERFRAQGFPETYKINLVDRQLSGDTQGRLVGNSVCPPLAKALVLANCADLAAGASRFEVAA